MSHRFSVPAPLLDPVRNIKRDKKKEKKNRHAEIQSLALILYRRVSRGINGNITKVKGCKEQKKIYIYI